jgi:hypothetical protein
MTRTQAAAIWPILKAYAEGQPIQFRERRCTPAPGPDYGQWVDADFTQNIRFNVADSKPEQWRVKP